MLEIKLLGQFDVRRDGRPLALHSRPAQSLLAYLLLTTGAAQRREKLSGVLWPSATDKNARSNLRHALWRLRQAFQSEPPGGNLPPLVVDALSIAFDDRSDYWLDAAILQRPHGEPACADELIESVAVYRGELLPGFYDEWAILERRRLLAILDRKMALLLRALQQERRWTDMLTWSEHWIAVGDTPEPAYCALMIAHRALGNVALVTATYRRCVQAMTEQLDAGPSRETRTLLETLLQEKGSFDPSGNMLDTSSHPALERRSPGSDRRKTLGSGSAAGS